MMHGQDTFMNSVSVCRWDALKRSRCSKEQSSHSGGESLWIETLG
jgi:hypothetical protein